MTARRLLPWLLLWLLIGKPSAAQTRAPGQGRPPSIALIHVAAIDADGLRPDQTVVFEGDRIAEVGPTRAIVIEPRTRVIDARGQYLIPGLWDMHAHASFFGVDRLPLFVINGVTGIRDLGGVPDSVFRWRADITANRRLGPRIVAAGVMLTGPGNGTDPAHVSVSTAEEARAAVRANHRLGADLIKVWSTIPREAYLAALDEAHRARLPLVGHLPISVSLAEALDGGQRDIEHLIGIPIGLSRKEDSLLAALRATAGGTRDIGRILRALITTDAAAIDSFDPALADSMVRRIASFGVWVCPTLTDLRAYTVMRDSLAGDERLGLLPAAVRDGWVQEATTMSAADEATWQKLFDAGLRLVGRMKRAGVTIITGTDAGSTYDFPGFDLHNELALLVRAGLSPLEALTAGTKVSADAAGFRDRAGMVKAGFVADLILLDANPLADIRNTRKIAAVVAAGRLLERRELQDIRRRIASFR
jgi:imidazolonepropionase-like amidohydrolase